ERARPGGGDGQSYAAAAYPLADSEVEDRGVVERLAPEHQDGVRELDGRHGGPEGRRPEGARQVRGGRLAHARVEVGRLQGLAPQALDQEAFLVGGLSADERAGCAPVACQPGGGVERALPRDPAGAPTAAPER